MRKLILLLLGIIAGLSCGISAGIGFVPLFKQPKNIKIQKWFGFVFIIDLVIMLFLIHRFHPTV